jgi:hypothetical protein
MEGELLEETPEIIENIFGGNVADSGYGNDYGSYPF